MGDWCRRRIIETGLLVLCGLASLLGVGFVAVGAYLSLREIHAPWLAGLIVGGCMVLLAALASVIIWRMMRVRSVPPASAAASSPLPSEANQINQDKIDNVSHLGEIIGAHISQRGIRTMDIAIAALAAGTILSAAPALRRRKRRHPKHGTSSGYPRPPYRGRTPYD